MVSISITTAHCVAWHCMARAIETPIVFLFLFTIAATVVVLTNQNAHEYSPRVQFDTNFFNGYLYNFSVVQKALFLLLSIIFIML